MLFSFQVRSAQFHSSIRANQKNHASDISSSILRSSQKVFDSLQITALADHLDARRQHKVEAPILSPTTISSKLKYYRYGCKRSHSDTILPSTYCSTDIPGRVTPGLTSIHSEGTGITFPPSVERMHTGSRT